MHLRPAFLPTLSAALLVLMAMASIARADETEDMPTPEGVYGDWSLYRYSDNGAPVCYLASRLQDSDRALPGRAPAYLLITNRPAEGKSEIVSLVAGFAYQPASAVRIAVGRRNFELFTKDDTAWANDGDDPRIVGAIQHGRLLIAASRAKDGIVVSDRYSLKGAASALAALARSCGAAAPPPRKRRKRSS